MRPTTHPTPAKRTRKPKHLRPARPNRLYKLRADLHLTLLDVARATKAGQSAISRWENSQGEPHERFRVKYAELLGITPVELGGIVYGE